MKTGLSIAFLVLGLFFNKFDNDKAIAWRENFKLTWAYFKANPDFTTKAAAVTASGISYRLSGERINGKMQVNCDVTAYFYPNKSWYKKELASDKMLLHEQLHFDITELHARKMRAELANAELNKNVKQEVEAIYNAVLKQLRTMQKKYDAETNFSRNTEQQLIWKKKVETMLHQTRNYAK